MGYNKTKELIENANHSLETGDWALDIRNLKMVMGNVDKYLSALM